jgi:hypothetical protein
MKISEERRNEVCGRMKSPPMTTVGRRRRKEVASAAKAEYCRKLTGK